MFHDLLEIWNLNYKWAYFLAALFLPLLWLRYRRPDDASSGLNDIVLVQNGISRAVINEKLVDGRDAPGFDNLLNFRDVGKSINSIVGKKLVTENKLFRSARPDEMTVEDRRRLRDKYGIKTILDLRTPTEHAVQIRKRQECLNNPSLVSSNKLVAVPLKIPGIDYVDINMHGRNFEMNMLWKLSLYNILKVITLAVLGYRIKATRILAKEAVQPRGLNGLAYDTLEFCGPEIAKIITHLSHPPTYPLLLHCTQGKDRTGVIIALVLFLLSDSTNNIPIHAIATDYLISANELLPERESRLKEIREIGLGDEWVNCSPDWVERLEEFLVQRWGGVRGYFEEIGVGEETVSRVVECLGG